MLAAPPAAAEMFNAENRRLLDTLDHVLRRAPEFNAAKESALEQTRHRLSLVSDPEEKYWVYRELYTAYSSYDSDSALAYSAKALRIARDLGRDMWADDVRLNRAYIMSATGMFPEARATLSEINTGKLTPRTFLTYCETAVFVQTHADQYANVQNSILPYSENTAELLAHICSDLPVNDPDYYWLAGWNALRSEETAAAMIPSLEANLRGNSYSTRSDAKKAWMLSALYNKTGSHHERVKYLILSAIADVRASVREIASLEEIASLAFECGDLDHANSYITYCIQCANLYRNRVRIVGMANLQASISDAYEHRTAAQRSQINRYFLGMLFLLLLLSAACVTIFIQLRRIRKRGLQLNEANGQLSDRIVELQDAREQLAAANQSLSALYASVKEDAIELARVNDAKEKYIADIFSICSDDISKLDEFRKKINRLIMAGRFDEVKQLTKNPELSHAELKELYANFDRIFLQIYPNFVEDFNSLLRPGEKIELKKGEMLNTELRIYALVRLGLNDSVKISRFLHCSVQTVYNTRLRIRGRSDVPREEFVDRVRTLGKPAF